MRRFVNPARAEWAALCERPRSSDSTLTQTVAAILDRVRVEGRTAVQELTERFDGVSLFEARLPLSERDRLAELVPESLRRAIDRAHENISLFHTSQLRTEEVVETSPGVVCFRRSVPIERVGLYIPGGSAPLFSTFLMLGVPAKLAGCREIVLVTPPSRDGSIDPAIAYVAQRIGVSEVYRAGGAQAIGALAFGVDDLSAVSKICGPGNRFVNEAKLQVAAAGVAIDLPAGPSEVLVIADEQADPAFAAADLLAQAEHGPDSQVVLVSTSTVMIDSVLDQVRVQVAQLPREAIAHGSLDRSLALSFSSLEESIAFSNEYAPEHLILNVEDPDRYIAQVTNAGSVFLGRLTAESFGDYASGTNHVLPTNGAARGFSGVSVDTFTKKITFQAVSSKGLEGLGPTVIELARAEGLEAHAQSIAVRMKRMFGKEL